jgi:hypothetical protein
VRVVAKLLSVVATTAPQGGSPKVEELTAKEAQRWKRCRLKRELITGGDDGLLGPIKEKGVWLHRSCGIQVSVIIRVVTSGRVFII